jgi:hypothetical protein
VNLHIRLAQISLHPRFSRPHAHTSARSNTHTRMHAFHLYHVIFFFNRRGTAFSLTHVIQSQHQGWPSYLWTLYLHGWRYRLLGAAIKGSMTPTALGSTHKSPNVGMEAPPTLFLPTDFSNPREDVRHAPIFPHGRRVPSFSNHPRYIGSQA